MLSAFSKKTGTMAIMGKEGDVKIIWDKDNADEVALAKENFDKMKKKGFIAYKVIGKGDKGEQIREFDRDAQSIILAPPMVGG